MKNSTYFELIGACSLAIIFISTYYVKNQASYTYPSAQTATSPVLKETDQDRAEYMVKMRALRVSQLEREVKKLPVSKTSENLTIYKELLKLRPNNTRYQKKVVFYRNALNRKRAKYEVKHSTLENIYNCKIMKLNYSTCWVGLPLKGFAQRNSVLLAEQVGNYIHKHLKIEPTIHVFVVTSGGAMHEAQARWTGSYYKGLRKIQLWQYNK